MLMLSVRWCECECSRSIILMSNFWNTAPLYLPISRPIVQQIVSELLLERLMFSVRWCERMLQKHHTNVWFVKYSHCLLAHKYSLTNYIKSPPGACSCCRTMIWMMYHTNVRLSDPLSCLLREWNARQLSIVRICWCALCSRTICSWSIISGKNLTKAIRQCV